MGKREEVANWRPVQPISPQRGMSLAFPWCSFLAAANDQDRNDQDDGQCCARWVSVEEGYQRLNAGGYGG